MNLSTAGTLFKFGAWMTTSNIISPLMVNMDRFIIGALISMSAVAYYVTPFDVVTKLLIIPAAIASVLFPAFSAGFSQDREYTVKLYMRGIKYVFILLVPMVFLFVSFSKQGLEIWLGQEFSKNSFRVMQILSIGVLLNAVAHLPFALIQAAGRPDITAKLHIVELPLYLLMLLILISAFDIRGAAIAWLVRVTVDCVVLLIVGNRLIRLEQYRAGSVFVGGLVSAGLIALGMIEISVISKVCTAMCVIAIFVWVVWKCLLEEDERKFAMARIES